MAEPRVIATAGPTSETVLAHHVDFPDLEAEGDTLSGATAQLIQLLTRALDDAAGDSGRESLRLAIRDVQAFGSGSEA